MKFDELIDKIKEIELTNDLGYAKSLARDLVSHLTNLQADCNTVYLQKNCKGLIETIKIIREYTGLGLKESKDIVDNVTCGRRTFVAMLPLKKAYNFRIDIERSGGVAVCIPQTNLGQVLYE